MSSDVKDYIGKIPGNVHSILVCCRQQHYKSNEQLFCLCCECVFDTIEYEIDAVGQIKHTFLYTLVCTRCKPINRLLLLRRFLFDISLSTTIRRLLRNMVSHRYQSICFNGLYGYYRIDQDHIDLVWAEYYMASIIIELVIYSFFWKIQAQRSRSSVNSSGIIHSGVTLTLHARKLPFSHCFNCINIPFLFKPMSIFNCLCRVFSFIRHV